MRSIFVKFTGFCAAAMMALSASVVFGAEEGETPHYPIKPPKEVEWSFAGPFGTWDIGQLQRGYKIYSEVCSACHSIDLLSFRNLSALGYTDAQVKAIAAEYEVQDGPDEDGEMFDRTALPSDRIPGPFANDAEAKASNNGAMPPDFSLLAKARGVSRGFPTFVFDVFTLYAEGGPDYIYSLLVGYEDAPDHVEIPESTYYNSYFIAAPSLSMAPPLDDESVTYDDGTPETLDQHAQDVAAFMMWAAEPSLVERKAMGFKVMIFLLIFAGLLYLTKKRVFSGFKD